MTLASSFENDSLIRGHRKSDANDAGDSIEKETRKTKLLTSSKSSQFGNRFLKDDAKVFEFNAWDDVEWDAEQRQRAEDKVKDNLSSFVSTERRAELEQTAAAKWIDFYATHRDHFFRDKNWVFRVFPDFARAVKAELSLTEMTQTTSDFVAKSESSLKNSTTSNLPDSQPSVNVFEVGCGVGNVVLPVLRHSPNCFVFCCDFASNALESLKSHRDFDENRCLPFQWDLTETEGRISIQDCTLDFIIMFFVLSAIDPSHFSRVVSRLSRLLRPGGRILFRDYGRCDMTQLRFKTGSAISDNFYVRGGGTRAYFFTLDEIRTLLVENGGLEEEFLREDKRLLVNRAKKMKMYRVWVLGQFKKSD